ncbi:MAG TPA: VCBS repeat-containing protein [Planctomycetota bacterium]|nr:VCBS repeat-containing protein [Planctomycetota bacterium]
MLISQPGAAGDFNHDGATDLVIGNWYFAGVVVYTGRNDGSFGPARRYPIANGQPRAIVIGDFNADGNPDLAVAQYNDRISILLGNKDGSFGDYVSYAVGKQPEALTVADFNGDGKLDLAIANYSDSTIGLLLGRGDGTFQPHAVICAAASPRAITSGALNSDSFADLVFGNGSNVAVALGNGDGSFGPLLDYSVPSTNFSFAWADYNEDGVLDIASFGSGTKYSVLFGTGTGTFLPAVNYNPSAGNSVTVTVVSADFDGDRHADLAVVNVGNLIVHLNDGTGTFGSPIFYSTSVSLPPSGGAQPHFLVSGLFDADNKPDVVAVNFNSADITLLRNTTAPYPPGQTISFSALPDKIFGDNPFQLSATASSGLPVSFSIQSGPATLNGSTLTITGAGIVTVRASQAGNSTYTPARDVFQTFTVAKANQSITFNKLPDKTLGDPDFTVSAAVNTGLPLLFNIASGPATITQATNTITLTGAGVVTVRASQAGNANYNSAYVERSFVVNKKTQSITFAALSNKTFGDASFTVSASANSGLAPTFSIASGPATINASTVTLTGAGVVTIRASQSGTPSGMSLRLSIALSLSPKPHLPSPGLSPKQSVAERPCRPHN